MQDGAPSSTSLATAQGLRVVAGLRLPLIETTAKLAVLSPADVEQLSGSIVTSALASKLAMDLVTRKRVVPTITRRSGRIKARWAAALGASEDAAKVTSLATSMPLAAHAVPVSTGDVDAVWAPDALLCAYLDAVVDALVRAAHGDPSPPSKQRTKSFAATSAGA